MDARNPNIRCLGEPPHPLCRIGTVSNEAAEVAYVEQSVWARGDGSAAAKESHRRFSILHDICTLHYCDRSALYLPAIASGSYTESVSDPATRSNQKRTAFDLRRARPSEYLFEPV